VSSSEPVCADSRLLLGRSILARRLKYHVVTQLPGWFLRRSTTKTYWCVGAKLDEWVTVRVLELSHGVGPPTVCAESRRNALANPWPSVTWPT
jgi:hypothetical protein